MKKVLSFDLEGTLVTLEFGEIIWNHAIPLEFSKKYGISFDEAKRLVISEYQSVGEERIEWYDLEYWLKRFDLKIKPLELLDKYEKHIRLFDGVKEALEMLKERFTLIISSNATRLFIEKELRFSGIEHFFAKIFSATSDFQLTKKSILFYKKVLEVLSLSPEEMVHVGDHRLFDYEIPKSLGIDAYLVEEERTVKEIVSAL
ncbi:MAG: HAD family hydrolase [Desulfobacterota bacterium]|nr:HAD family hydrolase [Thermodesulfobacteriota bacterium]MDW8001685.1 HAD family hydrolase [Deltaproteobacteria bacterium]